jgi:hypothetical protein
MSLRQVQEKTSKVISRNQYDRRNSEHKSQSANFARRSVLKMFAGAGAASLTAGLQTSAVQAIDYSAPVPESEGLTAYCNGQQILIRLNNALIVAYRAHHSGKYPYLNSLAGPATGTDVTTESSLPYPHHRGVWLGCDPLNGGDYWSDGPTSSGQIRSLGLNAIQATPGSIVFEDKCKWIGPNSSSPCVDERRFTVTVPNERLRLIDLDLKLTALEDLVINKAKHSFFAIRAASDISPAYGGKLMNSSGSIGAAATHGKPAQWCSFFGPRRVRREVIEGIALMDHPDNPWSPCPWLTRDYGHLSPSPFSFRAKLWTLSVGESIRLRYRIAVHAGDPQEANLAQVYKNWIS